MAAGEASTNAPTGGVPSHPLPLSPLRAGKFARDNCPAYLTPSGFQALKGGALEALTIVNGFFLPTLRARQYTKVRAAVQRAVQCRQAAAA